MRIKPKQLISAAVALAAIATVTTFAQSKEGQRALRRIGVAAAPNGYTELAFVNPARLPTTLRQGATPIRLRFTVTNRENATRTYRWKVVVGDVQFRTLKAGRLKLAQGDQAQIDPSVRLACSGLTRVAVLLTSGQRIDFWANCSRGTVGGANRTSVRAARATLATARRRRPITHTQARVH